MDKFEQIEKIAKEIWMECYSDIISHDQIEYMLNKYLTKEYMANQKELQYVLLDEGFYAYEVNEDEVFLSKLYIKKEYRGQKKSKEIVNSLLRFKKPIKLTVNKNNKAFYAYLKMGFKVVDSVISDIGNGYVMDDYIMVKDVVYEKAFAKINLNLKVINKREDGYHNLESLIVPIDLYDELIFSSSDILEYDTLIENDIVIKAYNLLKQKYNVTLGAKIILNKNIPISAGLAGGSADASATLRGLNKLWNLNIDIDTLKDLSLLLGSDTAYCMYNKPAILRGRGEELEFVDYRNDDYVLLVNPRFSVSTKEVFTAYNNEKADNDLELVTMNLYPELLNIKNELEQTGFKFNMSGSGPTLFTFSKDLKALKEIEEKFNNRFYTLTKKIPL